MKPKARSKTASRRDADTMLPEYDFSKGVRGQTSRRYADGSSVVVLDPDNDKAFPSSVAVSDALRVCARLKDAERKSERRWSKAFRRSATQLTKLADDAMKDHKKGRTRRLDRSP